MENAEWEQSWGVVPRGGAGTEFTVEVGGHRRAEQRYPEGLVLWFSCAL